MKQDEKTVWLVKLIIIPVSTIFFYLSTFHWSEKNEIIAFTAAFIAITPLQRIFIKWKYFINELSVGAITISLVLMIAAIMTFIHISFFTLLKPVLLYYVITAIFSGNISVLFAIAVKNTEKKEYQLSRFANISSAFFQFIITFFGFYIISHWQKFYSIITSIK